MSCSDNKVSLVPLNIAYTDKSYYAISLRVGLWLDMWNNSVKTVFSPMEWCKKCEIFHRWAECNYFVHYGEKVFL